MFLLKNAAPRAAFPFPEMQRLSSFLLLLLLACLPASLRAQEAAAAPADTLEREVLLETSMGNIRVKLYNDTPRHRDNFLRLVREGFYDGILFHRVIPNFMIQAGDSASRHAPEGVRLGDTPEPYTVGAEIRFPERFHKCGALAAAREDDSVNPQRASSAWQFYLVYGRIYDEAGLDKAQAWLDEHTHGAVKLTPAQRAVYTSEGGVPYLDGQYTVFGEITEGLAVVDRIQWVGRDENNRPFDDVRILRATVVR